MKRLEATAEIRGRRVPGPLDSETVEYEWLPAFGHEVAGDVARVFVGGGRFERDPRPGEVITVGPYRLRVLTAVDILSLNCLAMRDGWKARAYAVAFRCAGPLRRFSQRLILTAAVWGLADFHIGAVPTWRDLHVARWWQGKR